MIRLQAYAGFSLIAVIAVIYNGFSSGGQFYQAMVYFPMSKSSLVVLLNMGLVIMCLMWKLAKKIFLGWLREAEFERLNEQFRREVMEMLFAVMIFRQDFSATFLGMVATLLLIKALHRLAQFRIEYIDTTPAVPSLLSHIRIVSFLGLLLLIDSVFLYNSVKFVLETRQVSASLFFSFEYTILTTMTVSTFVKYAFSVSDLVMEGQWERKVVYSFYLELIRDVLLLSMYMCFFVVIFINYGVPLHLIWEPYDTFRNFNARIADYIRFNRITSNLNDCFPDSTPEELDLSDTSCIICRGTMTTAKKLTCGHHFHVHCLQSWLEWQNTCPTCRAPVIPPKSGTNLAVSHTDVHQQGTSVANSSNQSSTSDGEVNHNINDHQLRLMSTAGAA